ncbi:hypothetical protein AAHA92_30761 [Salvia divinorum]|uniref:Uncharacterized protein n=1 Tax=Salvia divinorum TaxID=28513 RepID=A0ABD1FRY2_SALDI
MVGIGKKTSKSCRIKMASSSSIAPLVYGFEDPFVLHLQIMGVGKDAHIEAIFRTSASARAAYHMWPKVEWSNTHRKCSSIFGNALSGSISLIKPGQFLWTPYQHLTYWLRLFREFGI